MWNWTHRELEKPSGSDSKHSWSGFQGLHWKQIAAVKLCMVSPSASLSWVPVHGCHAMVTHLHFTAALSLLSLSLRIWEGATSALCQCSYIPPPHPPLAEGALLLAPSHRMKIMLGRAESHRLFLWMCVTPRHLGALHCHPVATSPSLGVQSLLAMTTLVSLWQGHVPAAAQPHDPRQGHESSQCTPNLRLCDQARDFHTDLLKMWIKSWTWQLLSLAERAPGAA